LTLECYIPKPKKGEIISERSHQEEQLGTRDYSHLELTDVLQQGVGCIIPLSLHASPKHHEQACSPLCEAKAVLLVGLDILECSVSARMRRARDKLERLATHSDDLNDGKKNRRRCHRGWELQHGRDIGGYLGGGDHPVNYIATRTPSDGSEGHESYEPKNMLKGAPVLQTAQELLKTKSSTGKVFISCYDILFLNACMHLSKG
jgi:hypothetical protein